MIRKRHSHKLFKLLEETYKTPTLIIDQNKHEHHLKLWQNGCMREIARDLETLVTTHTITSEESAYILGLVTQSALFFALDKNKIFD